MKHQHIKAGRGEEQMEDLSMSVIFLHRVNLPQMVQHIQEWILTFRTDYKLGSSCKKILPRYNGFQGNKA